MLHSHQIGMLPSDGQWQGTIRKKQKLGLDSCKIATVASLQCNALSRFEPFLAVAKKQEGTSSIC